ncbi:MAG: crotonase/enoyl-CoA hydratase family protein [Dehalococcoidia bacterium]
MDYRYILTENRERVLHLTLNRPEKRNALSQGLLDELFDALRMAEADDEVGCIVIKGAGPAFCSGLDYEDLHSAETQGEAGEEPTPLDVFLSTLRTSDPWATLWNLSKPVIAQVHGYCIAGANDLALNCDVVIVAEDAQIGYPPVRATGSTPSHMWTYLVGPQWAKIILLTGDLIDGKTAARIGLAAKAVPAERLEDEVHSLARRMAMVPHELQSANKAICNKALELMGRETMQHLARQNDFLAYHGRSAQEFNRILAKDGLRAALEWRDGKFR